MMSGPVTRIKSKTPVPYELTAIHHDTHDTKTFCFALPDDATLDMLPGDHLYVHATIDGKSVKRPYTPSSVPGTTGYFDLTVKRYETGSISKYLHDREPGDTVLMNGPNSGGHWVDGMAKKVGFVAGGTGITPMISIIRWILAKSLAVELSLVFANKAEADIIFRDEWDEDAREHASFRTFREWLLDEAATFRASTDAADVRQPAMKAEPLAKTKMLATSAKKMARARTRAAGAANA